MGRHERQKNLWAAIKNDPELGPILHRRSVVDLKDKARAERKSRNRKGTALGVFSMVTGAGGDGANHYVKS